MPLMSFLPRHIWETLSESTKQMIIEHNKKVKLNNPTRYPSGSMTKPNPSLGRPTPTPKLVHQHSQDEPTEEPPSDTSPQTLVNQCLAESDIDHLDNDNIIGVMAAAPMIDENNQPAPENRLSTEDSTGATNDIMGLWTHSGICKRKATIQRNVKPEFNFWT